MSPAKGIIQLSFFSKPENPPQDGLIGLAVRLDRAVDRRKPCHDNIARTAAGKAQHVYELRCAACDAYRGWLPRDAVPFL